MSKPLFKTFFPLKSGLFGTLLSIFLFLPHLLSSQTPDKNLNLINSLSTLIPRIIYNRVTQKFDYFYYFITDPKINPLHLTRARFLPLDSKMGKNEKPEGEGVQIPIREEFPKNPGVFELEMEGKVAILRNFRNQAPLQGDYFGQWMLRQQFIEFSAETGPPLAPSQALNNTDREFQLTLAHPFEPGLVQVEFWGHSHSSMEDKQSCQFKQGDTISPDLLLYKAINFGPRTEPTSLLEKSMERFRSLGAEICSMLGYKGIVRKRFLDFVENFSDKFSKADLNEKLDILDSLNFPDVGDIFFPAPILFPFIWKFYGELVPVSGKTFSLADALELCSRKDFAGALTLLSPALNFSSEREHPDLEKILYLGELICQNLNEVQGGDRLPFGKGDDLSGMLFWQAHRIDPFQVYCGGPNYNHGFLKKIQEIFPSSPFSQVSEYFFLKRNEFVLDVNGCEKFIKKYPSGLFSVMVKIWLMNMWKVEVDIDFYGDPEKELSEKGESLKAKVIFLGEEILKEFNKGFSEKSPFPELETRLSPFRDEIQENLKLGVISNLKKLKEGIHDIPNEKEG